MSPHCPRLFYILISLPARFVPATKLSIISFAFNVGDTSNSVIFAWCHYMLTSLWYLVHTFKLFWLFYHQNSILIIIFCFFISVILDLLIFYFCYSWFANFLFKHSLGFALVHKSLHFLGTSFLQYSFMIWNFWQIILFAFIVYNVVLFYFFVFGQYFRHWLFLLKLLLKI